MKKLKIVLFSVLALGLTLTSCGDDDSSSNNTSGNLVGKWIYSQEKEGNGPLTDYEHTEGCDKDYMEISAQEIKDAWFYKDGTECVEESETATYTRNGNTLTVTEGGMSFSGKIEKLTATELEISSTETEEGVTVKYLSTYKRG
jgi:hypothetical protein